MEKKSVNKGGKKREMKDVDFYDWDEEEDGSYELFEASRVKSKTSKIHKVSTEDTVRKPDVCKNKPTHQQTKATAAKKSGKRKGLKHHLSHMDRMDRWITAAGALVLIFALVTAGFYVNAKTVGKEEGVVKEHEANSGNAEMIGEIGLLAVADVHAEGLAAMVEEEPVQTEFEEKDLEKDIVEVDMHLNSMQKDLKIKFVNKKTQKLIPNVIFEVELTKPDKSMVVLKDEDMDGVIYRADMEAGKCSVTLKLPEDVKGYTYLAQSEEVTIKDKIEYKKVNVADEVKNESEVNVAAEDTKKQETMVESKLQDTVGWVESTKTPLGAAGNGEGYEEVSKDKITDPMTFASAGPMMKFAAVEGEQQTSNQGEIPQVSVSLDQTSLSLKTGESALLTAITQPENQPVAWNSSDAATVSVDNGIITAIKSGSAEVTAVTQSGHVATCIITVAEQEKLPVEISISASALTLLEGEQARLEAQVKNAADSGVYWNSDHPEIVTVDGEGNITAVKQGTATVTAVSNGDASVAASCGVTVKADPRKNSTGKLKDNDGNQLFIRDGEGAYREAVYADYYTAQQFYKQILNEQTGYKYTGWQTLDGKTYYFDADGNKVAGEQVIQGAKYQFDGEGVLSTGSGNMGIDVSKWNGNIDWKAVKNSGVSYVIIRCGYRGSTTGALIEDPKFRSNIQGASAAGLKVGVYFFTQAVNEMEAVEEASMVLQLISQYKITYPVFLDVEPSGGRADGIGKDVRTAVCRAFCQTIQNSGYTAGIYANKTWLTSKIDTPGLSNFKIWLAQYAAAPSYGTTKYDMWQYTSKGSVAGISGGVDMNISYLGY